ncbi:ATP-binding protein [Streptosporangium sandarakinum]|uniref:ATP-binding protein n=1 Tax=Streptosporangium sandarakinum TaxID=1260955 RepID=UPI003D8BF03A
MTAAPDEASPAPDEDAPALGAAAVFEERAHAPDGTAPATGGLVAPLREGEVASVPGGTVVTSRGTASACGEVAPMLVDAMVELWPGGMTYRRTFPGHADQIPSARRFVRFLLEGSPRRDDAEQIVAELAANAVAHTASGQPHGTFIVEVARRISAIRVSPSTTAAGERPRGSLGAAAPIRSPRTAGAWHWSPAWPYGSVCGGHRRWATRSGPNCPRGERHETVRGSTTDPDQDRQVPW